MRRDSKHPAKDPFEVAEFSVAWAKDHIAELDREIDKFLKDENARAIVTEASENGIYQLFKIKFLKPMPRPLRGHATDTAINLRNALDQTISALYTLTGIYKDTTHYPFASDAQSFKTALNGRCKGLAPEISEIVRDSEPYKGGNDLLWALNRLSNVNKHSILRPVFPTNAIVGIEGFAMGILTWDPPLWDSDKNEVIFARIPTGTQFEVNLQATFLIGFNEVEFIEGQEVLAVFDKLVNIVEGIVMSIKAESRRIGLLKI